MDSDLDARAQRLAKTMRSSVEGLAEAVRSALDSAHRPETGDSESATEEIDLGSLARMFHEADPEVADPAFSPF